MSSYRKTGRKMPARQCPIAENEPIEIHKKSVDRARELGLIEEDGQS
jgi:hypothetical protein